METGFQKMQQRTPFHKRDRYSDGHLFVAAVRILSHRNSSPPHLSEIADMLKLSKEQAGLICRRLHDAGIISAVEGAFGERWVVSDHLKLEGLPKEEERSELGDALKKFQTERQKLAKQVENIKEQQALKKKELFAGIEKKLKKDLSKD